MYSEGIQYEGTGTYMLGTRATADQPATVINRNAARQTAENWHAADPVNHWYMENIREV